MRFEAKITALSIALMALAGCPDRTAGTLRPVDPRIEVCSAGATVSLSAEVKGELTEIIGESGSITGELERDVKTTLSSATTDQLSGAQLVRFQENYLQCLRDESASQVSMERWETLTLAECQDAKACEADVMAGIRICTEEVRAIGREQGWSEQRTSATAVDCFSETSTLPGCFRTDDIATLKLSRSRCERLSAG